MNKPKDKLGWKKAAAWVVGVAYVAWAAHDVYTRGWAGFAEVGAVTIALIGAFAGLYAADQYFNNPKRSSTNPDNGTTSTAKTHRLE